MAHLTNDPAPLPGLDPEPAAGRVVCRDCGRRLTGREARMWGRGRACRAKHGQRGTANPGRFDVEQDGLWEGTANAPDS